MYGHDAASAACNAADAWHARAEHAIWANTAPIEKASTASNGPCSRSNCKTALVKQCCQHQVAQCWCTHLGNALQRLFDSGEAHARLPIWMPSIPGQRRISNVTCCSVAHERAMDKAHATQNAGNTCACRIIGGCGFEHDFRRRMRRVRKHEFTVFECLAKGPCSQAKNTAILHKPMQAKHSERRHHTRTLPPGCPANLKSSAHQSMAAAACGVEVTINKRNFSLQLPARGPRGCNTVLHF